MQKVCHFYGKRIINWNQEQDTVFNGKFQISCCILTGVTMCAESKKPNVRDVVSNLSRPMPLTKKLSLLVKNNALKLLRLKNCCGHAGEPGC